MEQQIANLLVRISDLEAALNASAATSASSAGSSSSLDSGDNAWMMVSTALVYLMTPGVAFFYGGMVHQKNLLGTLSLSFLSMGIVTVQWILFGYSLAFGPRGHAEQLGGGDISWFSTNFGYIENAYYAPTFPVYTHAIFQAAFAVITPALISGAVVNKMKWSAYFLFVLAWTTIVYDVIAFWIWNPQGWLHEYGAIDFAGGCVIHISSGFSALVCSLFFQCIHQEEDPDLEADCANMPMTVLGGGLLWFGWIGFNAGSAGSAGDLAALALLNTNAAAASALLTFVVMERIFEGKSTVLGGISGAVVGLVVITPAAGYVRPGWALLMGIWGTFLVYIVIWAKRRWTKLSDPLDCFSCHGVGGIFGSLMTGLFCEKAVNPAGADGAFYGNGIQFWYQLAAVLVVVGYCCGITLLLLIVLYFTTDMKMSQLEATLGMDHVLSAPSEKSQKRQHLESAAAKMKRAFVGQHAGLTKDEERRLRDVFNMLDAERTGRLSLPQFLKVLQQLSLPLTREEAETLFKKADSDNSGTIEFEEFRALMLTANKPEEEQSFRLSTERGRASTDARVKPGMEMTASAVGPTPEPCVC